MSVDEAVAAVKKVLVCSDLFKVPLVIGMADLLTAFDFVDITVIIPTLYKYG